MKCAGLLEPPFGIATTMTGSSGTKNNSMLAVPTSATIPCAGNPNTCNPMQAPLYERTSGPHHQCARAMGMRLKPPDLRRIELET